MLPEKYKALSDEQTFPLIRKAKEKLGDQLLILGHHYQRDEVIQFADIKGDSLKLSKQAAQSNAKYIVFCGVHFMAETADMITSDDQIVVLPDINAGCPMADMAPLSQVTEAWQDLERTLGSTEDIIPITYINSTAEIKAFCGRNNGMVCTSANAEKILDWSLKQNKKLFFLPDKHLGRNTAWKKDVPEEKIALWKRGETNGGLTEDEINNADILIWNGFCPVHDRFQLKDIHDLRERYPEINILVHPEVPHKLALESDFMGSTSFIIKKIEEAPKGSVWAIATEIHLVARLAKEHPNKKILTLGSPMCMCSMMDRTSPQHLLQALESLAEGKVINQISVPDDVTKDALIAVNRMFELS